MATTTTIQATKRWKEYCDNVQAQTTVNRAESEADRLARVKRARADYAFFVDHYFPHYTTDPATGRHTPSAPFHLAAARKIRDNRDLKAAFIWARGHAKSSHMDIMIPMWLKCQETPQINVMVLVGKSEDNANTLLADLQAELQFNQRYIHDFGPQYGDGSWQDGKFVTADGRAFFARGRGQSPRGLRHRQHRPDYIVIDDIDDDELCNNEARVRKLTAWVKEALFGALDGGRGRFIIVGNLISECSVLANIRDTDGTFVSRVNAFDKNGRVAWESRWTPDELRAMERFMGYRAFQKEMMNNPLVEGAVFKHDWIRWKKLPPLDRYDLLVAYCDPSFKGSTRNDYKAIKLWGQIGTELHQVEAFVRQCSIAEMVRWWYDLHERLRAAGAGCLHYIEANFLQDVILDEFTREGNARGYQLPISADRRKKPDKFQRVEGVSPLWERGHVYYNADKRNDPDTLAGLQQTLAFEKGSTGHDDAPDADEGAIYILQKQSRTRTFAPVIGRRPTPRDSW
ncbi:MAG: hypothetical protein LBP56_07600 [Odoribacteraceae bacterium]|nr:hypothetical protein [Odoribacteraceae bacterium]